jgi:integrase
MVWASRTPATACKPLIASGEGPGSESAGAAGCRCFHGLRHSLGATLFDLGLDRDARRAALGHRSDAASSVYERGGNRRAAGDRAFAAYDNDLASIHSSKNAKLA